MNERFKPSLNGASKMTPMAVRTMDGELTRLEMRTLAVSLKCHPNAESAIYNGGATHFMYHLLPHLVVRDAELIAGASSATHSEVRLLCPTFKSPL